MRSPLARVLRSDSTPEEDAERMSSLERELWAKHRAIVVRLNDPAWPGLVRMAVEAIAKARFG